MSYVNGTQHYNLPQTVGTDKRDWADTNQAFADVDAALYQAVETAGDASTAVAALDAQVNGTGGVVERVSAAENDINTVEGSVATLQTTVANHTSQIADVRRDDQDMITAFNEPDATSDHAYSVGDYFIYNDILYKATAAIAVGATIVPNTNCAATNVTTEIKDNVVDISGKQDKTDNSLTTTSKQVVGAINELNSDLDDMQKNSFGSSVEITNYSTISNLFTTPSDGYIAAFVPHDVTGYIYVFTDTGLQIVTVNNTGVASTNGSTIFVRKGMKFYVHSNSGGTAFFYPIA